MKKRQIIILLIAVAILVGGKLTKDFMATPKERPAKAIKERITTVFTEVVTNDSIPVFVESTGVLKAENRIELFSEVQGVMEADNGKFKAGNSFKKGEVLIRIRSNDQQAQLYAQRSSFQSALIAVMPDIKADFSSNFAEWNTYLSVFSVEQPVQPLPKVSSSKLESFLVGRGVYSSYHALKNLEIINGKYNIRAPYNGVLISTQVDPGTVIRPGQALGVFIQPQAYELETSTDAVTAEKLKVGQQVRLTANGNAAKTRIGKVSRLVKAIDPNSQMSTFFVAVSGNDLKEGMFLNAKIEAKKVPDAFEISRSALVNGNQVYGVENGVLVLLNVKIDHVNQNTAIVSGLKNGAEVLTKIPPSAFEGMKVSVFKANQ